MDTGTNNNLLRPVTPPLTAQQSANIPPTPAATPVIHAAAPQTPAPPVAPETPVMPGATSPSASLPSGQQPAVVPPQLMPDSDNSSAKSLTALGIVAAIAVLLGGFAAYNALVHSKTQTAAIRYQQQQPVAHPSVVTTQATSSGTGINPNDTSNAQLQRDSQTINSEVNQLDTDLQNVDHSINDQPITISP